MRDCYGLENGGTAQHTGPEEDKGIETELGAFSTILQADEIESAPGIVAIASRHHPGGDEVVEKELRSFAPTLQALTEAITPAVAREICRSLLGGEKAWRRS